MAEQEKHKLTSIILLDIINIAGIEQQIGTCLYDSALDALQDEGFTDEIIIRD